MKNCTKLCAIILALTLIFVLTACDSLTSDSETTTEKPAAGEVKIEKGGLKIGVLYSGKIEDAAGIVKAQRDGLKEMSGNLGLAFQDLKDTTDSNQFIEKEEISVSDSAKVQETLDTLVTDGCNVIIATDPGYADVVNSYAQKTVDTKHVIFYQYGSEKMNSRNLSSYNGRLYDAYYLAGIVAGAKLQELNETKVGFVSAADSSDAEAVACVNAFTIGAQSVVETAEILLKVAADAQGDAAAALITQGCKVLAQYGGGQDVVLKAQEQKVFAIGYNADLSEEAPNAFLCAPVWNWTVCFETLIEDAMNATWKAENYIKGFNVGLTDVCKLYNSANNNASSLVASAKSELVSGNEVIFVKPLTDSNDAEVTDEQIAVMNFYIKGITVL